MTVPQSTLAAAASTASDASVSKPATTKDLLDLMTQRRSNYTLSTESTISDAAIAEILRVTLAQAPSTFGSYTTRMVLAVRDEHTRLWDGISDVVHGVTPADKWESGTKEKMAGFRNAYGTVLFFEDPTNTRALQSQFPFLEGVFPTFGQHTNAMHQILVWTALTSAGLGANLQHYSPLIDDKVKELYNVPKDWQLVAQLVFGTPTNPPHPKPTAMAAPMEERLRIFGAESVKDSSRKQDEDILDEKQRFQVVDEVPLEKLALQKTASVVSVH